MEHPDTVSDLRRSLIERDEAQAARELAREQRRAALRAFFVGGPLAIVRRVGALVLRGLWWLARFGAHLTWLAVSRLVSIVRAALRERGMRQAGQRADLGPSAAPPVAATVSPTADPIEQRERMLEALERQALANREAKYGPDHLDVASVAYVIAARCAERGDDDEARVLYERSLRIFEKNFGPDHPSVAAVLNDLAELHAAAGRVDQASECMTRASEIAERRHATGVPVESGNGVATAAH